MTVVELTRDYTKRIKAAQTPGAYWDAERKAWLLDLDESPHGAAVAAKLFPEVQAQLAGYLPETDDRPTDLSSAWAGTRTVGDLLRNVPLSLRDKLYRYQAVDIAFLVARIKQDGGAYCGWDRGLGKTLGTIVAMWELQADRVVIVCPNSAKDSVWRAEIEKWGGNWNVVTVGGTKAQRDRATAKWAMDGGVLLIHYEALRLIDWTKLPPADLVVCDEAHRLATRVGDPVPKFYKALKSIKTKYRLALSGSILINSAEDFYGALHWLFPKRYRSRWRDWNDRFVQYVQGDFGKVCVGVKPSQLHAMRQELGAFMTVRRKQDELPGLPERIEQTLHVELSPGQRKVYDEMARKFLAELPDGDVIMAPNVLAQMIKLRQIASGLDLLGETFDDSSKLDLAIELIEDVLPNKTVVFTWHRATAAALAKRLRNRGIGGVSVVTGEVPQKQRAALIEDFQTNPDTKVFVGTIKTIGESVTLHAAADVIFIEHSWTAADMDQAKDRVYRIGQTRRVSVTYIVAKDTVDETRVVPAVANKAALRRLILGGS